MALSGKIYIFLQEIQAGRAQWVGVSEDGRCLASEVIPEGVYTAMWHLGENSEHKPAYEKYYPLGYELVYIRDINALENAAVLNQIRKATDAFVNSVKSQKTNRKLRRNR